MRIIMHIDVNNAFLSWSALYLLEHGSKYDIRDSYAVIGGDEEARRGVVLAKSMSAKKLGIKTGETLASARRKCRVLKVYPSNFEYYKEMSKKLFELIKKYTPDIEIASIDECYLDYSGINHLYESPMEFAHKIQKEINDTLGFTVNIGIANNKLCAKMASDFKKPNILQKCNHAIVFNNGKSKGINISLKLLPRYISGKIVEVHTNINEMSIYQFDKDIINKHYSIENGKLNLT